MPRCSLAHLLENAFDAVQSGVDGRKEMGLLLFDHVGDLGHGFAQLGIRLLHQFGHRAHEFVQERLAHAHLMPVQHRPAQKPLDDVFFLVRAGNHVLVNGERAGPHVIGDPPQAPAVLGFRLIADVAHLARRLDQRPENVDVEVRIHALQHRRGSLQAHAGVDVAAGQRTEIVGRIAHAIELRENQVPNFHRAEFGLIINFAARPAHPVGPLAGCVGRPEIFVLAQALQPLGRKFDFVKPDAGRLVVVQIDRGRNAVGIQGRATFYRSKTPRPNVLPRA